MVHPWQINDYEIFGAGAQRKQLWAERARHQAIRPIELVRHSWSFLPGVEEETLSWLHPDRTLRKSAPPPLAVKQASQVIFPKGHLALGDLAAKIFSDYEKEMPWQDGLLDDHFRYFSAYLKPRFALASEVCQWEWIQHALSYQDLTGLSKARSAVPVLRTSPSLQVMEVKLASEILGRPPGLYAFVYGPRDNRVHERQLSALDAEILDLIEEDRETPTTQLLQLISGGEAALETLQEQEILVP